MAMDRTTARDLLQAFDFKALLIEIGWESVPPAPPKDIGNTGYQFRLISETVFEVFPENPHTTSLPSAKMQAKIHRHIEEISYENLIIFLDNNERRSRCIWYWVKREGAKKRPKPHHYSIEQPGDLFLSKIAGMVIEMGDRREDGTLPITDRAKLFAKSFDILPVTKKFYDAFSQRRVDFIELIQGIDDEAVRFWYGSVLLNRLMFIYFLQKKGFIQSDDYLEDKLEASKKRGSDRYYSEFLEALFFEGFAKPERQRSPEAKKLVGPIPYLNGGLFIRHKLELRYRAIQIPDRAFDNILQLFGDYSWYLDDTLGADDNVISPDVLGYIFEKYINQKAFGAYYTRSEITEYLCARSIDSVVLQSLNQYSKRRFSKLSDALFEMDAGLCRRLLFDILPTLSILDPACGSGAFLVAAMKNLLNIYSAAYGRIEALNNIALSQHKTEIRGKHRSLQYYYLRTIISDNLYGVDIMDEATEIARLRLFLALVSAAQTLDELKPLPNIDFNIMAGNSLIGLLAVDDKRYDSKSDMAEQSQQDFIQREKAENYRREVAEKNRLVRLYRNASSHTEALEPLRRTIDERKDRTYKTLNEILLDDFRALKIQYEQAQLKGKAKKRPLETADIEALTPFHWGYEFDEIISTRGGFDVIITNPPWEVFKPQDEEFFANHDDSIRQKRANRVEKRRIKAQLLEDADIRRDYLNYQSDYRHVSAFYRSTPQYKNQISRVNGRKQGTDINLYKLFTEQCHNLLRDGGSCGIVIPSGIYSDLGTKQLRQMLFDKSEVSGLFGFENRKKIFEDVDSRFKFIVLSFEKGGKTISFPAAFMRHDVKELEGFPDEESVKIDVDLVKRSSPASLSVTEFKNALDLQITEKMLRFPLLGEELPDTWNVRLFREFDMTNDSDLFHDAPGAGRRPLYEGKMIWQFEHGYAPPRYWIDEAAGRKRVLGRKGEDTGQTLDYQTYRLGFRDVARSTDTRTMIMTVLPPSVFCNHKLPVEKLQGAGLPTDARLYLCSVMNSCIVDFSLRQRVSTNLAYFFLYQTPVPRLKQGDDFFDAIVRRAAQLICTAPEYDDLAAEVGLGSHHSGVTDPAERAKLRAELDGMIAHIYGLSEDEFAYVLSTFPLVDGSVKEAALEAFRDVARGMAP